MIRTGIIILAIAALLIALAWVFQRRLIYLPHGAAGGPPPDARAVTLTTADGLRLAAWHFPAPPDAVTFLVAAGNAGNRSMRLPLARALVRNGFGVLLFDYRGFGGNPGSPSEQGLALDVRAARRYLVEEANAAGLVYFGESLGGGVVTDLAMEHPPAGLVLRSPFTELAAVGSRHYPFLPVRLLLKDRFPVAAQVASLEVPVLVVYGSRDTIVSPDESRAVADRARYGRTAQIEGADHNDPALLDGEQLIASVAGFARSLA